LRRAYAASLEERIDCSLEVNIGDHLRGDDSVNLAGRLDGSGLSASTYTSSRDRIGQFLGEMPMTKPQKHFLYFYVGLLLVCIALMLMAEGFGPITGQTVLPIAADGFKTVLGALLGAISAMLGSQRQA
jgi:hypothetical protein